MARQPFTAGHAFCDQHFTNHHPNLTIKQNKIRWNKNREERNTRQKLQENETKYRENKRPQLQLEGAAYTDLNSYSYNHTVMTHTQKPQASMGYLKEMVQHAPAILLMAIETDAVTWHQSHMN